MTVMRMANIGMKHSFCGRVNCYLCGSRVHSLLRDFERGQTKRLICRKLTGIARVLGKELEWPAWKAVGVLSRMGEYEG